MPYYNRLLTLIALAAISLIAEQASAQMLYQNRVSAPRARTSVPTPTARQAPMFHVRPDSKPFKHIQQRPTVSPYLNLVRDDNGGAANYQTLVRPQMEQLDFNRQQEMRVDRLDREFNTFRSESAYPQQGSLEIRETGHTTRFMNRSHYYPQ